MNAVKRRAPEKFDEKPLVDIAVRGRDNRFKKSDEKRLVKFVNAIARLRRSGAPCWKMRQKAATR